MYTIYNNKSMIIFFLQFSHEENVMRCFKWSKEMVNIQYDNISITFARNILTASSDTENADIYLRSQAVFPYPCNLLDEEQKLSMFVFSSYIA